MPQKVEFPMKLVRFSARAFYQLGFCESDGAQVRPVLSKASTPNLVSGGLHRESSRAGGFTGHGFPALCIAFLTEAADFEKLFAAAGEFD